jgi:CHAT domain-containing protein/tetratricopeptide (TPR) repeat protein
MNRLVSLVACVLVGVLIALPGRADDPPKKITPEERKELDAKHRDLNLAGMEAYQGGNYAAANKAWGEALDVARRLYPKAEYPEGHQNLATSLNNLGSLYQAQGELGTAEPLFKDALEMRKRLFKGDHPAVADSLNNLGFLYQAQGRLGAAERHYKDALEMRKRLFKGDHPAVAVSLNNLGLLYQAQGRLGAAEPLYKDSLEMRKRLFKGDHPDLARGLSNLGFLYQAQGKLGAAEPLFKDALEMRKRLFKGDHPAVAVSLNNLGFVYQAQERLGDAETLFKDALTMRKRLFKGDHPELIYSLNNLAFVYQAQGRRDAAEPLYKDALDMCRRLYKGDHPELARSLNSLGFLYWGQGKFRDAEPLFKDALAMHKRLFKGDHPELALSLHNLASLYDAQGKLIAAEQLYKDTLDMCRRLTISFARDKTEGDALTFLAQHPQARDGFLSCARDRASDPASAYAQVWADKGYIARVYERRQLEARAAENPATVKTLAELTAARRRRAELLLAPATIDSDTRDKRQQEIEAYEEVIEVRTRELGALLPASARADALARSAAADLQKRLPADAAVVDFLRYTHFERDRDKPGKAGEKRPSRYLAFVVTRGAVAWADLGAAADIESAVTAWRGAINSGKEIPAAVPAKVRALVWEKVRKELPANIKVVYLCPDQALCKVPFGALPGDAPGTVLLDDFALATIPHAPFLLDKLLPQDPLKNPPAGALVVGAVRYDAEPAPVDVGASRGEPLVKPGAKLSWGLLPNTAGEANGVAETAARKKLAVTRIEGDKATTAAVLTALPRAEVVHFATHGFFADESFRSVFQLDEKNFELMLWGERRGRAVNSPLVMTGLVFAGANNPKTPGRGILTGEQLIDLDLSGLELAVLSACETGLGDVAGGEGAFGLQRAFHYAGTRNVICSLWKVPDESTAALMNLFYRNLWDKNLSPMEALRQAQLEIYRHPDQIGELAKGFRGKFEEVAGAGGEVEAKPAKDGKSHPLLWAAFTLSGPGR